MNCPVRRPATIQEKLHRALKTRFCVVIWQIFGESTNRIDIWICQGQQTRLWYLLHHDEGKYLDLSLTVVVIVVRQGTYGNSRGESCCYSNLDHVVFCLFV